MADLLRVSLIGTLPNGEEWSTNPVYRLGAPGTAVSPVQIQAVAQAISAVTVPIGLRGISAPNTEHTAVRVEARTLGGVLQAQAEAVKAAPANGSGTNLHPFQTAWVSSLRTMSAGARSRGRLYWPATAVILDADTLRPSPAAAATFLQGVDSYLELIQGAITLTFAGARLVVWSRVSASTTDVTSIQVGDILDTQRRRRDVLVENYVSEGYS